VSAKNDAGYGTTQTSTPNYAEPSEQVPGVPVSVTAVSSATSTGGEIDIVWDRPRVPHHGIPCYGTTATPADCPTPSGGSDPESNGGDAINTYLISWSVSSTFSSGESDSGSAEESSGTSHTISGLVEGNTYYIRIAAYNSNGYGDTCEYNGDTCSEDNGGTRISAIAYDAP
jgi:hypothetical protein